MYGKIVAFPDMCGAEREGEGGREGRREAGGRERGGREGERREGGREALILQHMEVSQLILMLVNFILSIHVACHKFHGKFKQLCGVRRQHVVGRLTLAYYSQLTIKSDSQW